MGLSSPYYSENREDGKLAERRLRGCFGHGGSPVSTMREAEMSHRKGRPAKLVLRTALAAGCALLLGGALLASPRSARSLPLLLEGDFREGGLIRGRTLPTARVYFQGRRVRVGEHGGFVIGFGRKTPDTRVLVVLGPEGGIRVRRIRVESRRYTTQRIRGLPDGLVTPDAGDLKRIRREQARVEKARGHNSPLPGFLADFRWPVTGRISGVYGTRRILNGEPRQPHYGIDIAAPAGAVVRAPAPGVVRLAAPDLFFSGGTLILDHGHGLSSSFLHLSEFRVTEGDRVEKGEPIAEVGSTGRSTGPHLDWRINLFEQRLDPALLAGPMPEPGSPDQGSLTRR